MNCVAVNSTVVVPVQNVGTVQTVVAGNVMPKANSFWVLYGKHTEPTYLEDAGNGQQAQRDAAMKYIKQWRVCLDIGSNIGQWTRPLAKQFESVICFEPNPNFRKKCGALAIWTLQQRAQGKAGIQLDCSTTRTWRYRLQDIGQFWTDQC